MKIIHTNGSHADFAMLCGQLDRYLNQLAGGEQNRAVFLPHNRLDAIHDAFVAYRRHLGGSVLEQEAAAQGYRALVLETGIPMKEAVALYCRLGYQKTENYGPYRDQPLALCMKKQL